MKLCKGNQEEKTLIQFIFSKMQQMVNPEVTICRKNKHKMTMKR